VKRSGAAKHVCLSLLCLLILPGCARPMQPGERDVPPLPHLQPGIYVDIDPRWAHDGKRVAFLRATPDRKLQLYVVDGDLDRPLALLEAELLCPDRPYDSSLSTYASPDTLAWSPNDRKIAFERIEWYTFEDGQRLPGTGLWELDTFSGRVTPLALHPARYLRGFYYYHTPQWSPDGRYLSFVGEGIDGERVICLRVLGAQKPQEVRPRFDNYENSDWPTWAPASAGQAPALVYRQGIQRTASIPVTETLRRLVPGSADPKGAGEFWRLRAREYAALLPQRDPAVAVEPRVGHLAWSPDGRLAFTLTPDPNDYTRYELWVIDADGTGAHRVSPRDGRGYIAPVWIGRRRLGALSPEGARFAVVTVNIETRAVRTLGRIATADCDWSPDRSRIVYAQPAVDAPVNPDNPTTLRILETGIRTP
jgi:Tol biopolymer transport system component